MKLTARSLLKKTMLAGVTYRHSDNTIFKCVQAYGTVIYAGEDGITIQTEKGNAGETFTIPFDLNAIQLGEKAIYTLDATGEEVEDPDFVSVWTVFEAENRSEDVRLERG